MDTKSKNSNQNGSSGNKGGLYPLMFILCGLGFLAFVAGLIALQVGPYHYGGSYSGDALDYFLYNMWDGNGGAYKNLGSWGLLGAGILMVGGALMALGSFIYLCVRVGDRDAQGKIILRGIDRWYTEIQLLMVGGIFVLFGIIYVRFTYEFIENMIYNGGSFHPMIPFAGMGMAGSLTGSIAAVAGLAGVYLGLWFLLSMVKKLKAGTFLRQSLTAIFVLFLHRIFFRSGSTMQKVVIASILLILLSATVFLAPVVLVVVLVFAPKYVRKYDAIKQGVEEVRNGNLSYQIPVPEGDHSELDDIARNINQISEAVNITVQNELKNQRMKAELISNVSHDLKTPLTSMVTYIDLLKQEGLDSPRAMEYLDVLDNKTNRLRQLTEDLFEAAKAASGAMPVRLEKVELISLINQGLGELNEGINESGLEFILNNPKEKYYVWADGQLMWRVMENILGNVLKYAQPDTRVYMDVREEVGGEGTDPDMVIFEVKNISRQSLNIDAVELMERFKRGDEARSSDGSGLGLSIAKDLVKLQKGVFEVKIDGDLFKSIVVLNRYPESEGSKEEDSPKPPTETLQEES